MGEGNNPAVESVRRRLLTSVLSYYQEFIAQRRGNIEAQESLAEASSRVEEILSGLRALRAKGQIKLLSQTPVVEELRLSERQQAKAEELLNRAEDFWQDAFRDIGKVSAAELHRRFVERSRLNEAELKALLTPEQLRRLYQLDLQADVVAAFREPEVIGKLQLTETQRDQIRTIEQQEMARWRAGQHYKHLKPSDNGGAVATPALTKNERILTVLTTEQAIAWRELTGSPFPDLQR